MTNRPAATRAGRDAELSLDVEQARAFYRQYADETVARMRNPTSPTSNLAAVIVLQCETDARLRVEATKALDAARRADEALRALNTVIAAYDPQPRT